MPNGDKLVDEKELIRWYNDGWAFRWMIEQYRKKYGITINPSMLASFFHRKGLPPRPRKPNPLLPWKIPTEFAWQRTAIMLRLEARRREGQWLRPEHEARLDAWLDRLERDNLVVDFDPASEHGFIEVPRTDRDVDIIRYPQPSP